MKALLFILPINRVLILLIVTTLAYASPVSSIQPQNPGFWQAGNGQKSNSNNKAKQPHSRESGSSFELQDFSLPELRLLEKKIKRRSQRIAIEIGRRWPTVEISSQSMWVEYVAKGQEKRVVDFASNEIRVSFRGQVNKDLAKKRTRENVEALLGTTIFEALLRDPLFKGLINERHRAELGELVFSELFDVANPGSTEVTRLAKKMMQKAYMRYQDQLALIGNGNGQMLSNKVTYVIPLPDNRMRKKARQFMPLVKKYAAEFQVPADIMMSIMHTESHFNPLARSHIPAFGLMQIVPRTAGQDASRVIFNKKKLLSPGFLYKPENNIKVGAAYLNVLSFQYLKKIQNPVSRLYCTIASYNAGSASVARAFTPVPQMQKAVGIINGLSNQKVLMRLINYLPQKETKDYVEKVLKRRKYYSRT